MTPIFLILAVVIGLLGSFLYMGLKKPLIGNVLKLVATGLLIFVSASSVISGTATALPLIVVLLAFIGDAALATRNVYPSKFQKVPLFEAGLGAFALSYALLAVTFLVKYIHTFSPVMLVLGGAVVLAISLIQFNQLINLKGNKLMSYAVAAYMVILSAMTILGVSANNLCIGLGSIFLYASDSVIAQRQFNPKTSITPKVAEYMIIGFYYLGLVFALSQLCL